LPNIQDLISKINKIADLNVDIWLEGPEKTQMIIEGTFNFYFEEVEKLV